MYQELTPEVNDNITNLLYDYQQCAMGTINMDGFPEVSKVLAIYYKNNIFLLLSDLSQHTKNLNNNNNNVCVYFAGEENHKSALNNCRLSVNGTLEKLQLSTDERNELLEQFATRDPAATMYGNFGDFNIYHLKEFDSLFIEGFGRAYK